jgi:tetratricopeptide (TPR) repeat protein
VTRQLPEARRRLAVALQSLHRLHVIAPGLRATCGTAGALIASADGDYADALDNVRSVLASLEQEQGYGSNSWVAAQNDLARMQYMTGDFRAAWESAGVNLRLAKEHAITDASRYFAMSSVACNALRQGGRPAQALSFVDSILADVRRDVPNAELPVFLRGCRALAEAAMELPASASVELANDSESAKQAGMAAMANAFGAASINDALKHHDLAAADSAWPQWAPDEQRMLDAGEHGAEVVRLLLVHASLDIAHHRLSDASARIEQAAGLIAARKQHSNSDARDVEMMRFELAIASEKFADASRRAQSALDIARGSAIDPKSSAWIGTALLGRARAEAAVGDKARARASAQEALPHLEKNLESASDLIASARALAATGAAGGF